MNTTKTTNQRIKRIALAELEPADYQRGTSDTQVANIVKRFDEAKLGTLTVSLRDGKFHIIDGAHRAKAMRNLGYTHALCVVLEGLTYQQEADYFRKQNRDKRNLTQFDNFKAGILSEDEQCIRINDIVKANGFKVGGGKTFWNLGSIHALFTIANDYGYAVFNETLSLIANTWCGIPVASQYECLLGVAEFVSRFGKADFTARMADKFALVWYDYCQTARVRGAVNSASTRKKFCRIFVEHYNKGLNSRSKKRLVWLEDNDDYLN